MNIKRSKSINSNVRAIKRYWNFLEKNHLPWDLFPPNKSLKPTYRFRNDNLLKAVKDGVLSASTASSYMLHVIKFYEWAGYEQIIKFSESSKPFEYEYINISNQGMMAHTHKFFAVRTTDLKIRVPNRGDKKSLNPLNEKELRCFINKLNECNEEFKIHQLLQLQSGLRVEEACTFSYNLANQMTSADGNKAYLYDVQNRRVKTTTPDKVEISIYSLDGTLYYREKDGLGINYIMLGDKLIAKDGNGFEESNNSRMHYRPFGESIEESKDDVGYTGHKLDKDINLSYMQARYYDPVIGRFYSNDPVSFKNIYNFNRYAYAANNPYKYVDPDGMDFVVINSRDRKSILNGINSQAIDSYKFDKDGKLKKDKVGGGSGDSELYTKALDEIIGNSDFTLQLAKSEFTIRENYEYSAKYGQAVTDLVNEKQVDIFFTGKTQSLVGYKGHQISLITLSPANQVAHEVIDHAFPHSMGLKKGSGYKGLNSVLKLDQGRVSKSMNAHLD